MAKILVVDDDEPIRLIYQAYLTKDGHTVETAADGMQALEKIASFHPDLVMLDINMPKMSGFEVAKRMKENPETKDIPIFIMTSLKQELNIKKAYDLGIDEYITKPTSVEHLKLRVNKFLKKKGCGC
ncbi:MAG TPA: response regulator [Elusimicrobiales bacterium]|nr:response regulator [Elusimicrobiales bacterium]